MKFYEQISSFSEFSGINNPDNFHQVPDDWVIVISDVKGSTRAVQEGRFKEVNMLGASAIAILSNELKTSNTVSVFGGDGATLLMPKSVFDKVRPQFVGLLKLAKKKFGMELRVGFAKIAELNKLGSPIFVGKYRVSKTTVLAQLMGAGCNRAEALVKSGAAPAICLQENEPSESPHIDGLSCRLESFESRNGKILSIIIKPKKDGETNWVRNTLVQQITQILGGSLESTNPVTQSQLRWQVIPGSLISEIKLRQRTPIDYLIILFKAVVANVMLKFNISAGGFSTTRYKSEFSAQSDFKKFDDNLRMVIDCTELQQIKIIELLESAKAEGHIYFGVHSSQRAVVTCVAYSASTGDHVHFVDGEGCGYTKAAADLKGQIQK